MTPRKRPGPTRAAVSPVAVLKALITSRHNASDGDLRGRASCRVDFCSGDMRAGVIYTGTCMGTAAPAQALKRHPEEGR